MIVKCKLFWLNIISKQINPKTDGFTFTMDELKQASKSTMRTCARLIKKYTQYNIPAAYATMLTNKDSITRVYYGDLLTDDGQLHGWKITVL